LGPAEAEQLAEMMSTPPQVTLRANTLRISRDDLVARLTSGGIAAEAGKISPFSIRLTGPVSIPGLPEFREGLFTVQDESSQLAAIFAGAVPGETILDACAAPGGKATHLAQLMGNRGTIVACDASGRKLSLVNETAERLGVGIISTRIIDGASRLPFPDESFDRVLLDAPCSGIGVFRRKPEGKWWKSLQTIDELAQVQKGILRNVSRVVRKGGTILYATCSTSRREDEEVIDDFISSNPDFVVEDLRSLFPPFSDLCTTDGYFRSWPHRHGMDGFFAARMKRREG
jgi:16S rRNA (cytosine967-C5)-methyltransferase